MNITVFTSNQPRHIYLLNQLSSIADKCYAIIGSHTLFPGRSESFFRKSDIMQNYFHNVQMSEKKFFGGPRFIEGNINSLLIKSTDLNLLERKSLEPALNSDIFIVFGATFIRGWLADELVERKAINLHMGISPYYRGSSCNFWACYNKNYHLVGSTIHMLSKGLDNGDILYHAIPTVENCQNTFDFTMKSVSVAIKSLKDRILSDELLSISSVKQDKNKEISYTRNSDFDDTVAMNFLKNSPSVESISEHLLEQRKSNLFVKPYFG